jgi:hypothetical protein
VPGSHRLQGSFRRTGAEHQNSNPLSVHRLAIRPNFCYVGWRNLAEMRAVEPPKPLGGGTGPRFDDTSNDPHHVATRLAPIRPAHFLFRPCVALFRFSSPRRYIWEKTDMASDLIHLLSPPMMPRGRPRWVNRASFALFDELAHHSQCDGHWRCANAKQKRPSSSPNHILWLPRLRYHRPSIRFTYRVRKRTT